MSEVSEKQLEANRENAKLGGVKTEEGKEISKLNALKHGLLSKEVLLGDESEKELIELEKSLRLDLKPIGELEHMLVNKITTNIWRLKRATRIEKEMLEGEYDKDNLMLTEQKTLGNVIKYDFINYDSYGKFTRYETSIEKGLYKALHELQHLQSQREDK